MTPTPLSTALLATAAGVLVAAGSGSLMTAGPAAATTPITPLPPATVSVHKDESGTVASYLAAPGQANRLTVIAGPAPTSASGPAGAASASASAAATHDASRASAIDTSTLPGPPDLIFTDLGAPLLAGAGCQSLDEHTVACMDAPDRANIDLGDGDDTVTTSALAAIDGGSGDDVIVTTDRPVPKLSVLFGGTGNDRIDASAGGHATLLGGLGDDQLTGSSGDDELNGNGGDDTLKAGSGNDIVDGQSGADHFTCGAGADELGLDNRDVLDHPMTFKRAATRLRTDCEDLYVPAAAGAYSLFPEDMARTSRFLTIGQIESPAKPGRLEARDRQGRLLARGPLNRSRVDLAFTPRGKATLRPRSKTAVFLKTTPTRRGSTRTDGPGVKVLLEIGPDA